jgi:hypothetical protein
MVLRAAVITTTLLCMVGRAEGTGADGITLNSPTGTFRLRIPRQGPPVLITTHPNGPINAFDIIPWSATWDSGENEFAPDYKGPTVEAREAVAISESPADRPWPHVISGGPRPLDAVVPRPDAVREPACPAAEEFARNPSSATLTYSHPDIAVTLRFEVSDNGLTLTPLRVVHARTNRLCRFLYPHAVYMPVEEGMQYIDGVWGGLARNHEAIRGGHNFGGACPQSTHDLSVLLTANGTWATYSIQPADGRIFRRTHFGLNRERLKDRDETGLWHGVSCWTKTGEAIALPPVRLVRADSPFDVFAAYRRDNGMDTWPNLTEKLTPRLAETLPYAVHLKAWFRGIARYEQEGRMQELFDLLPPPPVLIEFVASTRNGRHDTYYPDFLDFDRKAGGALMMQRLIARFKERGDLVTMYTHPLWWHDTSDTVRAMGGPDAIAVRGRSGELRLESWPNSDGYAVGVWREPVRRFVKDQLTTLRDAFGFDMIFQDQYGTRNNYDFSPDFGRPPYAWMQSLFDMAALSASVLPVSGEGVGPDRAFRDLTATFGFYLTTMNEAGRRQFYDAQHRAGNTLQWPMATMVLHDKVAFYPHNLERTDKTRPGMSRAHVSWCLAAGMSLHNTMEDVLADQAAGLGNRRFKALAHVQRTVCSRFFGQPMTGFAFLSTDPEITRTTFANGLTVLASHAEGPHVLRGGGIAVEVPAHGFLALWRDRPLAALTTSEKAPHGMLVDWDTGSGAWRASMPFVERGPARDSLRMGGETPPSSHTYTPTYCVTQHLVFLGRGPELGH